MKKLLRSITAVLIAATMSTSANAEFFSGHDLLTRLRGNDLNRQILAQGYILGVHDAQRSITHCSPANLSGERLVVMARVHLESQIDLHNSTADVILGQMMRDAWPCRNRTTL